MTNHNDGQLNVSHRLSRRLNNATGQCPVVCSSHVDNDGTVAHGVSTSRCPVICPVVPSYRRFLDQLYWVPYIGSTNKVSDSGISLVYVYQYQKLSKTECFPVPYQPHRHWTTKALHH